MDRIKDLILCSGYNVYPRMVEEAIHRHPAVSEAIVIGVPDAYRGETPKAYVVVKPGESLTASGLLTFLKEHLSPIEMPKRVEFRDNLPRTPIGKPARRDLVEEERAQRVAAESALLA